MTPDTAWSVLVSQRVLTLATNTADGPPHLVPITFAPLGPRRIVSAVDAKPKSTRRLRRLENIAHDARVTLFAQHYEDDWTRLRWVRAEGTASVSESAPGGAREALIDRYPAYADHDLGPWIVVGVERVTGWSAGR